MCRALRQALRRSRTLCCRSAWPRPRRTHHGGAPAMEVQENGHRLLQNGTRQPAQELMNFDWVPTQRCTAADTKFWPLFNVGLDFITENNKNIYINGWNMIGDELKDDWESSAILQETCARSFARARNSLSSSVAALQVRREPVRGDLRLPGVGGGRGRPGDPGDADPVHRAPIKSAGALGTPALLARPSSHPAYRQRRDTCRSIRRCRTRSSATNTRASRVPPRTI